MSHPTTPWEVPRPLPHTRSTSSGVSIATGVLQTTTELHLESYTIQRLPQYPFCRSHLSTAHQPRSRVLVVELTFVSMAFHGETSDPTRMSRNAPSPTTAIRPSCVTGSAEGEVERDSGTDLRLEHERLCVCPLPSGSLFLPGRTSHCSVGPRSLLVAPFCEGGWGERLG